MGGRAKKEITCDYSVFMVLCGPNLTAFRKTSVCFVLFLKLGRFGLGFFPSVLELFIAFFKVHSMSRNTVLTSVLIVCFDGKNVVLY